MHLNGQVLLGINQLCQNRELLELVAVGAKAAGVRGNILCQRGAVGQIAGSVRVAGQYPRLCQRVKVALDAEIGAQAVAAP